MAPVLGDVLTLAAGIAISPLPIIAAILMLMSSRARVTSVGFLVGWAVGIVAAVSIFTVLASVLPTGDPDEGAPVRGAVQLVLGALLLLLAARSWRTRPRAGAEPALPKWMQALDDVSLPLATGLGFMLSALNPKNLVMAASAGTTIAGGGLSGSETTIVIVIFTLLAASTVLIPVVGYLVAAEKMRGVLAELRGWLLKENAVIMAVLLVVIGVSMLGKGIGSF